MSADAKILAVGFVLMFVTNLAALRGWENALGLTRDALAGWRDAEQWIRASKGEPSEAPVESKVEPS